MKLSTNLLVIRILLRILNIWKLIEYASPQEDSRTCHKIMTELQFGKYFELQAVRNVAPCPASILAFYFESEDRDEIPFAL